MEMNIMATMLIQHQIKDFDTWKQVFDSAHDLRTSNGEQSYQIYQSTDDPNYITGVFTWDSLDHAKSFANSSELKEAMGKAGVVGAPSILYLDEI